jgi:phospholipid/cholesterol/gamma-HCH transport system ATP-binding protein
MQPGAPVQLEHVKMAFGDRPVFDDLSCAFPARGISVVLGGSGSGKSTLLRLVGGLIRPRAGRILVDGEDVTRLRERELFRVRRKLGMLFQHGALLD